LNRLFPVSDVSCYRSSQVARFLASVNELRKGKDAAAERLCSTFHALPKLPHCRHDTARAKRVDGDGGIKAAIWGGALAARHACVVSCKSNRYHNVFFSLPILRADLFFSAWMRYISMILKKYSCFI